MAPGRRQVVGGALAAAVLAAAALTSPTGTLSTLSGLSERPVAFAALLVGIYLVRPFVAWPTMAVSAGVGYVLGPVVGLPVALAGAVLTSLPAFYLGEWFQAGEGLADRLGAGGRSYFRRTGNVRGVTAARLSPIPADAVSVAAGLSDVPLRAYAAGTVVGELPWTVAAVVVGGSARTVATTGPTAVTMPLVAVTTLAALVLLAGPLYRVLGPGTTGV